MKWNEIEFELAINLEILLFSISENKAKQNQIVQQYSKCFQFIIILFFFFRNRHLITFVRFYVPDY